MKKMKTESPQHLVIDAGNLGEDAGTFEEFVKDLEDQQKETFKASQRPTFLWAEIKKSSKYFDQMSGKFPVCAQNHEYCLRGGSGGRYRVEDVNLFAKVSDVFIQLI